MAVTPRSFPSGYPRTHPSEQVTMSTALEALSPCEGPFPRGGWGRGSCAKPDTPPRGHSVPRAPRGAQTQALMEAAMTVRFAC